MSSQTAAQYRMYLGARVLWPPDCPDDILEGAINETQSCLKTYEAKDGQKMAEHLKKYLDTNFEPFWHVFLVRISDAILFMKKKIYLLLH